MKNAKNDKRLKKLVNNPKRLKEELFVKLNSKKENINPSEQQNYPGPQKYNIKPSHKK
jgi:hypothetical protein